jgi:hypothetical protein
MLLHQPVHTPLLISLEKRRETGLALRVTDLFSFRRADIPVAVRLLGYQGKEGVWAIVIVFRVAGGSTPHLEGKAYLNPRLVAEYRLLRYLTIQERFQLFFVSPSLKVAVGKEIAWLPQHRQEARMLLAQIDHWYSDKKREGEDDPDFEAAKTEFHACYSVHTLLAAHAYPRTQVVSSFRGVVLE